MGPLPVQRRSQTRDDATGSTRGRLDLLVEIWRQLGTGLDADALSAVVDLLEAGVSSFYRNSDGHYHRTPANHHKVRMERHGMDFGPGK